MTAIWRKNRDFYGWGVIWLCLFSISGCTNPLWPRFTPAENSASPAPSVPRTKLLPYGAIHVAYADVYAQPDVQAERLTECMYGDLVRVESENAWWYGVKVGPYPELEGWVHKTALTLLPAEARYIKERALATLVIRQETSQVFIWPSATIAIVMGTELPFLGESGEWYLVRLPNNDIGRIARAAVAPKEVVQPLIVAKPKDAPPVILAKPQSQAALPGTSKEQRSSPAVAPKKSPPPLPDLDEMTPQRQDIVTTAQRFLGIRYIWGGTTTRGFDCSGFTYLVYKLNGIELPRLSTDQFDQTVGQKITKIKLSPGDLVFFQTISKGASHVGIYIGNRQFIHASPTYGVTIGSFDDAYFSTRYVGARTIFPLS